MSVIALAAVTAGVVAGGKGKGGGEVPPKRDVDGVEAAKGSAAVELTTAEKIGILRDAARGKGNFGLGQATETEADVLGKAWVGSGYRVSRTDGKTLISANGLRQYRPPSLKPNSIYATTGMQANFESRSISQGVWQSNGHLNITGP